MKFTESYGSLEIDFENTDTWREKQIALKMFELTRLILTQEEGLK